MRCEDVALDLPGVLDRGEPADRRLQRHVDTCLRCQAELVQYRRLLRAMHQLRTEILEPAPGLLAEVLAQLEAAGERRMIRSILTGRNVAYAGGIAAATAASAAGAVVLLNRARTRKLSLAS